MEVFKSFFSDLSHEFDLPLTNPVLVFSLLLLIILLSPLLLKKLRVPGVIVLIISGVIIGPYGLNFLEKNSATELFSTIGLLYIMFIAGLELDLNEFKIHKNKSLVFGFFTFILPLSIGFPVCYYFLNYDFNASLLTSSMFATHTLVAYPIVSKYGISKNQAVAIAVGGTILTDTAVLIILAIIMGNSSGQLNSEFWIKLGVSLALFSIILFAIVPVIAQWFFRKLESEKHSHYIFVLSTVFFAAFLAELAGIEPIIGAFMAGLALNKLIPHSSALMNRIEFIGNALFIPIFLISVGMLVNIRVIFSGTTALIVAATLTTVALFGKWVAAFLTQLVFKFTSSQRGLIFGLSSAHAAATIAIILIGYEAGLLDDNILNGTIILILITCLVASFATERAAKKIILDGDSEILKSADKITEEKEIILLPIANFQNIERLLEFSVFLKNKKSKHPISVLSVVSNNEEAEINILKARKKLEEVVKHASGTETDVRIITTIDHNTASGINRISKEIMADIVILGWPQKTGIIDKIIGEKVDNIIHNSDKTTLITALAKPLIEHKRIVAVIPPLAQHELGFATWLSKIGLLASELKLPILFYTSNDVKENLQLFATSKKWNVEMHYENFDEWSDLLIISRNLRDEDLMVLVSARRGSLSYITIMDNLPSKLEKYFAANSRLIVYPQQKSAEFINENYQGLSSEPIERIAKIFKK
jgi:Kef-type K+ transport system membrane component KefB